MEKLRVLENGTCEVVRINTYLALKEKHAKEVNDFPMFFAFSNDQFAEGMQKIGLNPSETDKIYSAGAGGYYKKTDAEKLHAMFKTHDDEMKQARTNEEFIFHMFDYELGNHEYTYTGEVDQTLDALGLTMEEINNNELLSNGLKKAKKAQWDWNEKHN